MNKLTAVCIGNYVSRNGNVVFRYKVSGSPESMQAYADAQGSFLTIDDVTGDTLWFTTRFAGDRATVVVTDKGKIYADMTEFHKQASLAKQFGGNLGQELAKVAASKLTGAPVETPVAEPSKIDA